VPLISSYAHGSKTFTAEVLGRALGAFSAIRGLEAEVEMLEYREGGVNDVVHRLPGAMRYPNIVLSGGLTSDAVEDWFSRTRLGAERHTMTVTLMNDVGQTVRAWSFADAFPVRWSGPMLDANTGAVAGEELEIAHGGMTMRP
jgi:phage tail-like protein